MLPAPEARSPSAATPQGRLFPALPVWLPMDTSARTHTPHRITGQSTSWDQRVMRSPPLLGPAAKQLSEGVCPPGAGMCGHFWHFAIQLRPAMSNNLLADAC